MALMTPDPTEEKGAPAVRPDSAVNLSGDLSSQNEGVFGSLISSVRDVFFPVKLPPLVLESKPIAVPDRMAVKRDPKSTAAAVVINGSLLLLAVWWGTKKIQSINKPVDPPTIIAMEDPPKAPPKAVAMGGGGGSAGPTPVVHGNPPKFEKNPIVPPATPPLEQPKIKIDPSINVQTDVKFAHVDTPAIGLPTSPLVGVTSGGGGSGGGLGSGHGNGLGQGEGGNTGGGLERIGGGVSAPEVLFKPEPEFSEEARKAKVAGVVTLSIVVDANGTARNVKVVRALGMGLDEKAVEAVKQYRFKPAMKAGKPVSVAMYVEVDFQIF
ncbi:protein TonB [Granulicella rosea]|uniref:Protein TonB n=1 Tax=Granulicella rosea TaxID=474952 RepID=A0A239HSU6_9BACT|nr:energy transducer TonB [Granulicella rosea]SNS83923.1 protein TonB [Granulicella rosea]